MWFRFLLVRLATLGFFCALPVFFWPPPPALAVFCFVVASGIAAFGLLNPESRIARLIVTLVVAFLPILGSVAPPSVTPEMLPYDAAREWINFFLAWFAGGGVGTPVLLTYLVTLLALVGLEVHRSRLEAMKAQADLRIRPVVGSAIWSFDPVIGAYAFEVQIVVINQTDSPTSMAAADLSFWGIARGSTQLAPLDEAIMELSPGESVEIPARGEAQPFVLCTLLAPPYLKPALRALDSWFGRFLVPVPARLELRGEVAGIRFWAAPKQVRMPSKSKQSDEARP